MKSIWIAGDRRELQVRLLNLTSDRKPLWGRMNAPQMVTHLSDALRMALGELTVAPKKLPLRYFPLKQLVLYCLPFPRGAPTAPELISRSPADWKMCTAELQALREQFATRDPNDTWWPEHPAFGPLSGRAWGKLVYKHTDHHLRQFGV
jgi:hypothetical protein